MEESVRLQKYIASCGVLSRRKAEEAVMAGRVLLNGVPVAVPGVKVNPLSDRVEVDGRICVPEKKRVYLLMNKLFKGDSPRSVTAQARENGDTRVDVLPQFTCKVEQIA